MPIRASDQTARRSAICARRRLNAASSVWIFSVVIVEMARSLAVAGGV